MFKHKPYQFMNQAIRPPNENYRMITGPQIRAARGLMDWSQKDLATRTGLGMTTTTRMETLGPERSSGENIEKVLKTFAEVGIEFLDAGEHGAGLRFRDPPED